MRPVKLCSSPVRGLFMSCHKIAGAPAGAPGAPAGPAISVSSPSP